MIFKRCRGSSDCALKLTRFPAVNTNTFRIEVVYQNILHLDKQSLKENILSVFSLDEEQENLRNISGKKY
jgi:hypothetical protein